MTATEWGWTQNDGKAPDTRAVTTARRDGPSRGRRDGCQKQRPS